MRVTPKTEEEIDTRSLLPKGEYHATVIEAADEVSKNKGSEQIHLLLRVEDDNGNRNAVHDYLLDAMAGKLRHFCLATGLMDEYQSGELVASHCTGQDVRVKLDVEKDKAGQYPDKNVVRDYLVPNGHGTAKPATQDAPPSPAGDSAKVKAWKSWLVVWSKFLNEFPEEKGKRDENWRKCFDGLFPGREPAKLSDAEWDRFRMNVQKWDPINGWAKAKIPANPISENKEFDDADIPF